MPHKKNGFIDRLPIICAAGKESKQCESVGDLFNVYSKDVFAEKMAKDKEKLAILCHGVSAISVIPENNQLKDIMAPDLNKSHFLEFRDRFYENLYFKKVPLGKPIPAYSKPDHITNENDTFGELSVKSESAYTIALPNKRPKEVLQEYVKWHDKYRLSHGNYFPGEKIKRGYSGKFDPNRVFGISTNVDMSGAQVKNILQDTHGCFKPNIVNKAQHKPQLGKPFRRQGNAPDSGTVFGHVTKSDEFHVNELLGRNLPPKEVAKQSNTTTYRTFSTDLYNYPIVFRKPAGLMESKYPRKEACKFYAENLGEETTAKQLISPSIPTHFGLSHRDFFIPRPKDQIHRIFTKAGFDLLNEEYFNKVWTAALDEWTSMGGQVSVEAFKYALDKIERDSQ